MPAEAELRERSLLIILAGVQFTHLMDFMVLMPLGPQFMRIWGISTSEFAVLVSAYTLSAAIASVLSALYIDRFDRKRALLFLYGGFVVSTLLCAAATDYGWLLAARTVSGAFGGVAGAIVYSIIGDVIPEPRRGAAMGGPCRGARSPTPGWPRPGRSFPERASERRPSPGAGCASRSWNSPGDRDPRAGCAHRPSPLPHRLVYAFYQEQESCPKLHCLRTQLPR